MARGNVQFRDASKLVDAYKQVAIPAFSVTAGNQLLYSWVGTDVEEGANQLSSFLELLEDGQSSAVYTLKVYKKLKRGEDIDNRTPYHGSYNFCLLDQQINGVMNWPRTIPPEFGGGTGLQMAKTVYQMQQDLAELKKHFEAAGNSEEDAEEDEEPQSIGSAILTELKPHIPALLQLMLGGGNVPAGAAPAPGGQINGITVGGTAFDEAQTNLILAQVRRLSAHTADVVGLLTRLANFADKSPDMFASYAKML